MPTELKEAKVRVTLDLKTDKEQADTLEKKVERTRDTQEKTNRDAERDDSRGSPQRKITSRELLHGNLYNTVVGILKSIPFGVGMGIAVGIGAAELNERFGPGFEAFLKTMMPSWLKDTLDDLGIDLNVSAEMSKEWSDIKAKLSSISAAYDRTLTLAATTVASGGALTPGDIADEFSNERQMAEFQISLQKEKRRILQMETGKGAGEAVRRVLEDSVPETGT